MLLLARIFSKAIAFSSVRQFHFKMWVFLYWIFESTTARNFLTTEHSFTDTVSKRTEWGQPIPNEMRKTISLKTYLIQFKLCSRVCRCAVLSPFEMFESASSNSSISFKYLSFFCLDNIRLIQSHHLLMSHAQIRQHALHQAPSFPSSVKPHLRHTDFLLYWPGMCFFTFHAAAGDFCTKSH